MRLATLIVCLFAVAAHAESIEGSGVSKTEARKVGPFTALEVSGAYELTVAVGGEQSVELTADDNVLPAVKTEVAGDTLKIFSEGSVSHKVPLSIKIAAPKLTELAMAGAGSGSLTGAAGDALAIKLSGATNLTGQGAVKALSVDLSGTGKAELSELKSERATVSCSGAGGIDVHATEALTAKVSRVGKVTYSGNPKTVERDVSGVGSVSRK
jgi:hypothetical protein